MTEIKAPNKYDSQKYDYVIFSAGSIEMGEAEQWQSRLSEVFVNRNDVLILNPRRDDWDNSWTQSIENKKFAEQVNWELRGIETADFIFIYIQPDTLSPITLLEIGYAAGAKIPTVIVCPEGFWRRGNLEVLAARAEHIHLFKYWADGIVQLLFLMRSKY